MQRLGFIHDMMDVKVLLLLVLSHTYFPAKSKPGLSGRPAGGPAAQGPGLGWPYIRGAGYAPASTRAAERGTAGAIEEWPPRH